MPVVDNPRPGPTPTLPGAHQAWWKVCPHGTAATSRSLSKKSEQMVQWARIGMAGPGSSAEVNGGIPEVRGPGARGAARPCAV